MKKLIKFMLLLVTSILLVSCTVPQNNGLLKYAIINDQINYSDTASTEIRWDHMPLTFVVEGDHVMAERAAREFNFQVRFKAFTPALPGDTNPDVVIITNVPIEYSIDTSTNSSIEVDKNGGTCIHSFDRLGRLHARITVKDLPTNRFQYIAMMHEYGHAIGLAHDDFNSSLMRRYIWDDTEVPWNAPINSVYMDFVTSIDERDIRLLRSIYVR